MVVVECLVECFFFVLEGGIEDVEQAVGGAGEQEGGLRGMEL